MRVRTAALALIFVTIETSLCLAQSDFPPPSRPVPRQTEQDYLYPPPSRPTGRWTKTTPTPQRSKIELIQYAEPLFAPSQVEVKEVPVLFQQPELLKPDDEQPAVPRAFPNSEQPAKQPEWVESKRPPTVTIPMPLPMDDFLPAKPVPPTAPQDSTPTPPPSIPMPKPMETVPKPKPVPVVPMETIPMPKPKEPEPAPKPAPIVPKEPTPERSLKDRGLDQLKPIVPRNQEPDKPVSRPNPPQPVEPPSPPAPKPVPLPKVDIPEETQPAPPKPSAPITPMPEERSTAPIVPQPIIPLPEVPMPEPPPAKVPQNPQLKPVPKPADSYIAPPPPQSSGETYYPRRSYNPPTTPPPVTQSPLTHDPFLPADPLCEECFDGCEEWVEGPCVYNDNYWYQDAAPTSDGCDCYDIGEISPIIIPGVKAGTERSILEVRALLPLMQDDSSLLFADIGGRFDDKEASEGQFGIGYRTYWSDEWLIGAYAYYDLLKTNQRNRFNQFTTGLELLSEEWDVRINGYFPNEGAKNSNLFNGISNGTIISNAFEERASRGFNVEAGKRVLQWGRFDTSEVRWFVGYYRLDNDAPGFRRISGPSTRLEYRNYDVPFLGEQSRLLAGVELTSDDVRNEQLWGYLRVQIPFAPFSNRGGLSPLRRRMVDLPSRFVD